MRPCGLLDPPGGQTWALCAMGGRELVRPLGPSDPQVVAGATADRSRQGFGEVASLPGRPVSAAQAMELLTVIAHFFGVQIEGAACPAWPGGPKFAAARGAVQASSCPGPWLMARLAWREGVQAENCDNHMS